MKNVGLDKILFGNIAESHRYKQEKVAHPTRTRNIQSTGVIQKEAFSPNVLQTQN